jgi:Membrane domain of glycerophosphoryl diester phosphodiesterase
MAELGLRPLSLGEILDRTFSLYRRHFLLFIGITGLPHLMILALNLVQVLLVKTPGIVLKPPVGTQLQARGGGGLMAFGIGGLLVGIVIYIVAYLFSQGGTIYAVSELYLGRTTTIGASLRRVWGQLANLFGVCVLNGLAVGGAMIFLIIPGIYVGCRLITCVPAALLEDLGARESLERSFQLTKDSAGRAFVIYLLYFVLLYAAILLFMIPFGVAIALAAKDPSMLRLSLGLMQVGQFLAGILVSPFLLIATSVFYYDLRVRKEAFDLQLMMNPSGNVPSGSARIPSMLS